MEDKQSYVFLYLIGSHRKIAFFDAKNQGEVENEIVEILKRENIEGSLIRDCILCSIAKRW